MAAVSKTSRSKTKATRKRPAPAPKNRITVRAVEAKDHVFSLTRMQRECFPLDSFVHLYKGYWVMAFVNQIHPIGFAVMMVDEADSAAGNIERVGVMPGHRGHRLQLRLLARCEVLARKLELQQLIATTFDNPAASNNFIYGGWLAREPEEHYAGHGAVYWFKEL